MLVIGIILGAILVVNPYLPSISEHARWIDVLSTLGVPILGLYVVNARRIDHVLSALGMVILLLIPWLLADWQTSDGFSTSLSARWLELSIFAVGLAKLNSSRRCREGFALGIVFGAAGNCALLWLQSIGFTTQLIAIGLAYPSFARFSIAVGGAERFSGLHGHPNAAAAIVSLCIPAAISLNTEFKKSWLFVLSAVMICIVGALLTSSRSSFVIAGLILLVWLYQLRIRNKYLIAAAFLLASFALIYGLAFSRLNQRWSPDSEADENATLRWQTTKQSAGAILQFPLGLGSDFHERLHPPLIATHNAFTQLALCAGLPLVLLVIMSFVNTTRRLRVGGVLPTWLAAYLLGICFFEEHFNNPTFISLTLWIVLINIRSEIQAFSKSSRRRSRAQLTVMAENQRKCGWRALANNYLVRAEEHPFRTNR